MFRGIVRSKSLATANLLFLAAPRQPHRLAHLVELGGRRRAEVGVVIRDMAVARSYKVQVRLKFYGKIEVQYAK